MKINKEWLKEKWVSYAFALCIAILFYLIVSNLGAVWKGLGVLYSFISPVVAGIIIAYVLNPVMDFFERTIFSKVRNHILKRGLAVFFTCVSVILAIAILLIALIPQIVNSIANFIGNLEMYANTLQGLLYSLNDRAEVLKIDISSITRFGTEILSKISANMPQTLQSIFDASVNIGSGIFTSVISFIMAIYFLSDKENMVGGSNKLFSLLMSEKDYSDWKDFWKRCNDIMLRYVGGDILDAVIVGIANCIFMSITGMPYSVLISVIVGVTNLAPTFGPIVGAIIGGFILLLANPWDALWFIIFTIILQTIDGYVIKPKLFGNTFGISSVWILIAIIVFGRVFGIVGVLLAIPFTAILDFVYHESFLVWLARRKENLNKKSTDTSSGS